MEVGVLPFPVVQADGRNRNETARSVSSVIIALCARLKSIVFTNSSAGDLYAVLMDASALPGDADELSTWSGVFGIVKAPAGQLPPAYYEITGEGRQTPSGLTVVFMDSAAANATIANNAVVLSDVTQPTFADISYVA